MRRALLVAWSVRSSIAIVLAISAMLIGSCAGLQATKRAARAQEAIRDVQCVALSAVMEAGRGYILKWATSRDDADYGQVLAREYGVAISTAVRDQTDVAGLVRRDGSLDCGKLEWIVEQAEDG
jgi:hypothetical protein